MIRFILIALATCLFGSVANSEIVLKNAIVNEQAWTWEKLFESKSTQILFITYARGQYEAEELGKRFGFQYSSVPVEETAGGNSLDLPYLKAALDKKYQLIVISSNTLDKLLPKEYINLLLAYIKRGGTVLCFGRDFQQLPFENVLRKESCTEHGTLLSRNLPVEELEFMTTKNKLSVSEYKIGEGKLLFAAGYDVYWLYQSAFIPNVKKLTPETEYCIEIAYALTARLMAFAMGIDTVSPVEKVVTGNDQLDFSFNSMEGKLGYHVYTIYGEEVNSGSVSVKNGVASVKLERKYSDKLLFVWSASFKDGQSAFGAAALQAVSPLSVEDLRVPEHNEPGKTVTVTWKTSGKGQAKASLELFDYANRIVSRTETDAAAGKGWLPAWPPQQVTYTLLFKLTDAGKIFAEKRIPVNVQLSREHDAEDFQVITWGREAGYRTEKLRYALLKNMGITAITTTGGDSDSAMASAAGLRVVPNNIYVPPGRFNRYSFDPVKRNEQLAKVLASSSKYVPLGYILADEPSSLGISIPLQKYAAAQIRLADAGAPVGYSGVWLKIGDDAKQFLEVCNFVQAYSPHHLYSPDLWMGTERDILRSFHRRGNLLSCWTQYCPELDHEPYSRTMPYLLLFEGQNGISLFCSGGHFPILPYDNIPTHESRWWMEEIAAIQQGIGKQLIAAERDTGNVRVLFPSNIPDGLVKTVSAIADSMTKALNIENIPYKFIADEDLKTLDPAKVKLLILPGNVTMSDTLIEDIRRYAEAGGTVAAFAPTALLRSCNQPEFAPFWREGTDSKRFETENNERISKQNALIADYANPGLLFGFKRSVSPGVKLQALVQSFGLGSGVPVMLEWNGKTISALTGGDVITADSGEILASFVFPAQAPPHLEHVFKAPAILKRKEEKGKIFTFNFRGNPELMTHILAFLRNEAKFADAPYAVQLADGRKAPDTYLFPFRGDKGMDFVGVIQNYIFQKPAKMTDQKETAAYYLHGPNRWNDSNAVLVLPAKKHIYLPRLGKYLGYSDRAEFTLEPGRPEIFSLLDAEPGLLELDAPTGLLAGEIFKPEVRLKTTASHVIRLNLLRPDGTPGNDPVLIFSANQKTQTLQIPFNAAPGNWKLIARDAVTGIQAERIIRVAQAAVSVTVLPETPCFARIPVILPAGNYKHYQEENLSNLKNVETNLKPLGHTVINSGKFAGYEHLTMTATFTNRLGNTRINYAVMNDPVKMKWTDKRLTDVGANVGISLPLPNIWYYNGFIQIKFDDKDVIRNYVMTRAEFIPAGENGKLELEWGDTPYGRVKITFFLTLSDDPLYFELETAPNFPTKKISVSLLCYANSFLQPSKVFAKNTMGTFYNGKLEAPSPGNGFALLADEINDLQFGRGNGPGAIHVIPNEWTRYSLVPYYLIFESEVARNTGETSRFHFALRMFPGKTNSQAYDLVRDTDAMVRETLQGIYNVK